MDRAEVLKRIGDGKFFTIKFIKRTDQSIRIMKARTGVKKGLKGTGAAYDPKDYNLITVYDLEKKEYRSINCDQILEIASGGEIETFDTQPKKKTAKKAVKKTAKKVVKKAAKKKIAKKPKKARSLSVGLLG